MSETPLVSISITSYNHEKYIQKSLESVLNQEVNFPIEIIISNDNSSDKTEEIIKDIINTHPKGTLIKYYHQQPNLGYVPNLVFTFDKAIGKYIAVLDGDDYWTDPHKLQKQVDFLEAHPDFSAIASDSYVFYEDVDKEPHAFTKYGGKELDINDLLNRQLFQTSTFMFRKEILENGFPLNILSADRGLYLLAGTRGKVKVLPEQTSAYRKFKKSLSAQVSLEKMQSDWNMYPFITSKTTQIDKNKFKSYLHYTTFAYTNPISKSTFQYHKRKYLWYTLLSQKTLNPIKLRKQYQQTLRWVNTLTQQKTEKGEIV